MLLIPCYLTYADRKEMMFSGWLSFSRSVMCGPCDPMDCSLPGAPLQGIFLIQGSNLCLLHLLHCQVDTLPPSHERRPLGWAVCGLKKYDFYLSFCCIWITLWDRTVQWLLPEEPEWISIDKLGFGYIGYSYRNLYFKAVIVLSS